ncbi:MAG TPA: hypothetical protein VNM67_05775 [Thermoanaerobaculia bacterium]|jgi:hypothetical protein|nr:hypothetical protein [Thermoanaerobaculia bacterium]
MESPRILFLVPLLVISVGGFATKASAQSCEEAGFEKIPPACTSFRISGLFSQTVAITVKDTGVGLCQIRLENPVNVSSTNVPVDFQFRTTEYTVNIEKIERTKRGSFVLRVTDCCSNEATCDPVLTGMVRLTGKPGVDTYSDIPEVEGFVTVMNGTPGLRRVVAIVNGERFSVQGLRDGEEVTIDATRAMKPGSENTISLGGYGKPGSSAAVMIWEGPGN